MRRLPIILIVTALFATACGGGDNSLLSAASSSNWCDFAQKVEDSNNALDEPTAAGMRDFADQVEASVSHAPAEIKADVELLASFADDLVTALEENDDNILLAFDSISAELSDPKYEDAGDRVSAYNERECGIVDSSSSDSSSSDSPDSTSDGSNPFDSSSTDSGATDSGTSDIAPAPGDNPGGVDPGFDPAGVDGLIAGLAEQLGITEEQARCLFTALDFTGAETPPIDEMMNAFGDCGVDPLSLGG